MHLVNITQKQQQSVREPCLLWMMGEEGTWKEVDSLNTYKELRDSLKNATHIFSWEKKNLSYLSQSICGSLLRLHLMHVLIYPHVISFCLLLTERNIYNFLQELTE